VGETPHLVRPSSTSQARWHSVLSAKSQQAGPRGQKSGTRLESLGSGELPRPLNLSHHSASMPGCRRPHPGQCPLQGGARAAVGGLGSEHDATWGRNAAPKSDRSNLEEVELQG